MRLGNRVTRLLLSLASRFGKDVSPDGSLTVRVNKAIYGLGESSRQWKDHLAKTLSESGYSALRFDSSTYAKRAPDSSPTSIICTHVDDLLVVDWEPDNRASLIESLTRKYGKVKLQIGPEFVYLGLHITQRGRAFHLDQRSLITLLDYPRPNREPSSPANPDILDTDTGAAPAHDAASFRSTLMRLLYITTKTRFDLMFATNILASRQQACTRDDEAALSQLVAYVKRTADFDYVISPSNDTLDASADASYACHRDGKGHTGVVCSLGGTTIYARSAKQRLVAKSSTEAELLALNAATDEVLFLRNMLTELGRPPPTATIIWQDNLSAITLAQRGELGTKRTKHFTVRHYFVSHHIALGNVALRYQAGASIAADGLTKPVTGAAGLDWATLLLTGKSSSRDDRARGGVLRQDSAASYEPTRTDPRESL